MNLTTNQRVAIRAAADGHPNETNTRTYMSLRKRGYLDEAGRLTGLGQMAHRQIMASGDGPEALKAMFRF